MEVFVFFSSTSNLRAEMTYNGLQLVEKRQNPRKGLEARLIVNPLHTPYFIWGGVQNVSLGGIRVRNRTQPSPFEKEEEVRFFIKNENLDLNGVGKVVWTSDMGGEVGIKFTQLSEEMRSSLENFLGFPDALPSFDRTPIEFYHFSENPFNLTPDPRFLFLAISHYEALSSMISGIKERKGITILTGEVGTGKTTLIKNSEILKKKNLQIVPRKVSPGDTWFRVVAGEFATKQESLKTIQTLRQQGLLPAFGAPSE